MNRQEFVDQYTDPYERNAADKAWVEAERWVFTDPVEISEAFSEGDDSRLVTIGATLRIMSHGKQDPTNALGLFVRSFMLPYLVKRVEDVALTRMPDYMPVKGQREIDRQLVEER